MFNMEPHRMSQTYKLSVQRLPSPVSAVWTHIEKPISLHTQLDRPLS